MAVYKRGYERYQGPLTGRVSRLLVVPRFAWHRMLQQRHVVALLIAAMFWPLGCAGFIYASNHAELLAGVSPGLVRFLRIESGFFLVFMNTQSVFAVVLSAFAGPSLIAPDLSNGALPLYFSRPVSRVDYVLSRMLVLVGLLSVVTWIPGILLFCMQSGMAGWTWFAENWHFGLGLFLGFVLWILLVSLVALASSAYVRWRVVAGALVIGFFFVLTGAAELVNAVLRASWASVFNPSHAMNQIWHSLLGAEPADGPGATACWLAVGVLVTLLVAVLERKLRPVEVVS
jgi:ABC-2 type transport system permease protein